MKTAVLSAFWGVCIFSMGVSLQAQETVDERGEKLEICAPKGRESISLRGIADSVFAAFREADSSAISKQGNDNDTVSYSVVYSNIQSTFTGTGVNADGIVSLLDLKDTYVRYTVRYTRNIEYIVNPEYLNKEEPLPETLAMLKNLFGRGETQNDTNYPQVRLIGEREWHLDIRVKKSLPGEEVFDIAASTECLDKSVLLTVPDRYEDMQCGWIAEGGIGWINSPTSHTVQFTRNKGARFLSTWVLCTIRDCSGNTAASAIQLRSMDTPETELAFDDCLSTADKSIRIKASNPFAGVKFEWEGLSKYKEISRDSSSQTIMYPVPDVEDFTIAVKTYGGCNPSRKEAVVHRKIDAKNIVLQVFDTCISAGILFPMATEPPLPNMRLKWEAPDDFNIFLRAGADARQDVASVQKKGSEAQKAIIGLRDVVCGGYISREVFVTEAYTPMVVRTERGRNLYNGDSVLPGERLFFTAPRHSSITGYEWVVEDGIRSIFSQGTAEKTVEAPMTKGESITVTVSYRSCRGIQRYSYTIKTLNDISSLFEEL